MGKKKSQIAGILLCLLFGPFGLLYSMGWKAVIAIIVAAIIVASAAEELFGFVYLGSILVSFFAVRRHNGRDVPRPGDADSFELEGLKSGVNEVELTNWDEKDEKGQDADYEIVRVKLDAERIRLEREKIGLELDREKLQSERGGSEQIRYSSLCTSCGASTPRALQEGTTLRAVNCSYCGSLLGQRQ